MSVRIRQPGVKTAAKYPMISFAPDYNQPLKLYETSIIVEQEQTGGKAGTGLSDGRVGPTNGRVGPTNGHVGMSRNEANRRKAGTGFAGRMENPQ